MAIKISHLDKLFTCFPLTVNYRHMLADDKTYLYFTDYWFLLRYTVIIYKFTQGNLGAKKNRKLRHWRPTARSLIDFQKCLVVSSLNICILTFNSPAKQWQLWPMTRDLYKKKMYQLCCNQFWHRVSGTLEIFFLYLYPSTSCHCCLFYSGNWKSSSNLQK